MQGAPSSSPSQKAISPFGTSVVDVRTLRSVVSFARNDVDEEAKEMTEVVAVDEVKEEVDKEGDVEMVSSGKEKVVSKVVDVDTIDVRVVLGTWEVDDIDSDDAEDLMIWGDDVESTVDGVSGTTWTEPSKKVEWIEHKYG